MSKSEKMKKFAIECNDICSMLLEKTSVDENRFFIDETINGIHMYARIDYTIMQPEIYIVKHDYVNRVEQKGFFYLVYQNTVKGVDIGCKYGGFSLYNYCNYKINKNYCMRMLKQK